MSMEFGRRYSPEEDAESSDYCAKHQRTYFPSDSHGVCPSCWTEYRKREAKAQSLPGVLKDIGKNSL